MCEAFHGNIKGKTCVDDTRGGGRVIVGCTGWVTYSQHLLMVDATTARPFRPECLAWVALVSTRSKPLLHPLKAILPPETYTD